MANPGFSMLRIFSGLYPYEIWCAILNDGKIWIRMGCLKYTLTEWTKITIRGSNLSEFPDDGSEKSEQRARAFAFAVAEAKIMQKVWKAEQQ